MSVDPALVATLLEEADGAPQRHLAETLSMLACKDQLSVPQVTEVLQSVPLDARRITEALEERLGAKSTRRAPYQGGEGGAASSGGGGFAAQDDAWFGSSQPSSIEPGMPRHEHPELPLLPDEDDHRRLLELAAEEERALTLHRDNSILAMARSRSQKAVAVDMKQDEALARALQEQEQDEALARALQVAEQSEAGRKAQDELQHPREHGVAAEQKPSPERPPRDPPFSALPASPSLGREESTGGAGLRRLHDDAAADWLKTVEETCGALGEQFSDSEFGPGNSCAMPERPDRPIWTRPAGIQYDGGARVPPGASWRLFAGDPKPEDVRQGMVGDCWFLSALSVLASYERGTLIRKLFPGGQGPDASHVGAYAVRICHSGAWKTVYIDDQLPCSGGGRFAIQPAYASLKNRVLWPALVEKALAKLSGGYRDIVGGLPSEALHLLTGWPCTTIDLATVLELGVTGGTSGVGTRGAGPRGTMDVDMLWVTLLSALEAQAITCASSLSDEATCAAVGLVPCHAYAITRVHDVTDPETGAEHRLLQLRNPHGAREWQGDWSDHSRQWTPILRSALDVVSADDGVFWMCLRDFLRYFRSCTICQIHDDWAEARVAGELVPHMFRRAGGGEPVACGWELTVFAETEAIFDVSQLASRLRIDGSSDLGLALFRLSVEDSRKEAGVPLGVLRGAKLHASAPCTLDSSTSLQTWLHPGRYLAVPLGTNHTVIGDRRQYVLACLSSRPVALARRFLLPASLREVFFHYISDPQSSTVQERQNMLFYHRSDGCTYFTLVKNMHTSLELLLRLDFDDPGGTRVSSRGEDRDALSPQDTVKPMHQQFIAAVAPVREDSQGMSVRMRFEMHSVGPFSSTSEVHTPLLTGPDSVHSPCPVRVRE